MKIKNTKSFIEFCEQIGITDNISKKPSAKFISKKNNVNYKGEKDSFNNDLNHSLNEKNLLLNNLKKQINKLNCNLRETSTNLVFGKGNINANVMLIGEAPGSEEDKTGEPFVGKEGKLLEKMLNCIEINKKDVYLTNLIFWRPPGNRKPNPDEIKLCLPFTKSHINIINPKLLILFGGVASKAILNIDDAITKIRGKEFLFKDKEKKIISYVLFHPTFLIQNPIEKKTTWFDLLKIQETIKKL